MSILTIAQRCAARLELNSSITTFVGSSDGNLKLLNAMLIKAIEEIKDAYTWPELQREYTFSLVTNQDSYPPPNDYDRRQNETLWNRTQHWPLIGPLDAVDWQNYVSGLVPVLPRQRFRVKGWAINQFFINGTPSTIENGQTCVFEYISTNATKPKPWVASTSWLGIQYCSYNGYIFDRGSTGAATTGTTAPTPSVPNDGSIAWTLYTAPYTMFVNDSDEVILDNEMIATGAVWRFRRERGLAYEDLRRDAEQDIELMKVKLEGAGVLTINQMRLGAPMIGPWSYPISNYGI